MFLYTSGRYKRLQQSTDKAPSDFLYGYSTFLDKGLDVHYLETDLLHHKKTNPKYWWLRYQNNKFADYIGVGNRSHFYLGIVEYLNSFDVLIATNDSIALGLVHYKRTKKLIPKIIFLNMGLGGALEKAKGGIRQEYLRKKEFVSRYLQYFSHIVSVGYGEYEYFMEEFAEHKDRFKFIPFGVDIDYWVSSPISKKMNNEPYLLFAGNDLNRDYELALAIARECSDISFVFATSRIAQEACPDNVILRQGHVLTDAVTDHEMREWYQNCAAVLVLLNETVQPSGQTVALQGMSCGRPVILTKTKGLWDRNLIRDRVNCLLVKPRSKNEVISVIRSIVRDSKQYEGVGFEARKTVCSHYSAKQFSENLLKIASL